MVVCRCLKGHCEDNGAGFLSVVADSGEDGAKGRMCSFAVLWVGVGENLFPRRVVQPWEVPWGADGISGWERVVAQTPPGALSMQHFTHLRYLSTVRKRKKKNRKETQCSCNLCRFLLLEGNSRLARSFFLCC